MKTVIYTADILRVCQISDPILSYISLRLQCKALIPDSGFKSMDVSLHFESQAHAKHPAQITCAAAWLLNQKKLSRIIARSNFPVYVWYIEQWTLCQ